LSIAWPMIPNNCVDIVRIPRYYILQDWNPNWSTLVTPLRFGTGSMGRRGSILTEYVELSPVTNLPEYFPFPPAYVFARSSTVTVDKDGMPHDQDNNPAVSANMMSWFWTEKIPEPKLIEGDHRICNPVLHSHNQFPAVIEVKGLRLHYSHAYLHRKSNLPAVRADKIVAHWFTNNKHERNNGPATVELTDYCEFWFE